MLARPPIERLEEEEFLPLVGDVDGIICGDDRITAACWTPLRGCKVISKWGTGIDSIDVEGARQPRHHGVQHAGCLQRSGRRHGSGLHAAVRAQAGRDDRRHARRPLAANCRWSPCRECTLGHRRLRAYRPRRSTPRRCIRNANSGVRRPAACTDRPRHELGVQVVALEELLAEQRLSSLCTPICVQSNVS